MSDVSVRILIREDVRVGVGVCVVEFQLKSVKMLSTAELVYDAFGKARNR